MPAPDPARSRSALQRSSIAVVTLGLFAPYLIFCAIMTGTPGPNNAMVLASGVRVGVRRSLPLVFGIAAGVGLHLAAVGLGVSAVIKTIPSLYLVLKVAGVFYLFYLAYKIATSGPVRTDASAPPPLGFWGGVAFQWANPKSWAIGTSAVAAYVPTENYTQGVIAAAMILSVVAVFGVGMWAVFGNALRRFLIDPRKALWFNVAMAALLLASTIPAVLTDHSN